jgi:undecaprenyl-diphosphatase
LPRVAVGDFIEQAFGGAFLGPSFFITAIVLLVNLFFGPDHGFSRRSGGWTHWSGIAQAVAILRVFSRSGAPSPRLFPRGIEREAAIRFSFLLSIPRSWAVLTRSVTKLFRDGSGLGVIHGG